jgi:hypothetical protein
MKRIWQKTLGLTALAVMFFLLISSRASEAALVGLQQGTATFSQTSFGGWSIDETIDGVLAGEDGWSIDPNEVNQTAAFESALDFGFAGGTDLTFKLTHGFSHASPHTIGLFRLSVTTDDRSLFADGLDSGGDVTANWVVLTPLTATATGATLSILGDGSIRASGAAPALDVYTVTAFTSLTNLTGMRLEVLEDPSFPGNGPGRAFNGNFALSELTVDAIAAAPQAAVPEPASLGVWAGLALIAVGVTSRRRRKNRE